jgi:riboflavin kinase/FMN adenylyltransferase
MHLGHQAIVRRAVAEARAVGGQVVVLTFHPHPVAVLAPDKAPPLLQSLHDRLARLRDLEVHVVVVGRCTPRFATLEPEAFVRDYLGRHLELVRAVVGYNVSFAQAFV